MKLSVAIGVFVVVVAGLAYADGPPKAVPINKIDKNLTSGERLIQLPVEILQKMAEAGIKRAIIAAKLCISATGVPTSVDLAKGSSYQAADDYVLTKVRAWRFDPYIVDGEPVPVCTAVMFRYSFD
jgi:hypothetical protein